MDVLFIVDESEFTASFLNLKMTDLDISAPEIDTKYIEVPGRNGDIDASEALTGYPTYRNRTITATYDILDRNYAGWQGAYSEIAGRLHGRKGQMIFTDTDPYYYWEGRFSVSSKKINKMYSEIVIELNTYPYKLERYTSEETADWVFDDFDFETQYAHDPIYGIEVSGEKTVIMTNNYMPFVPVFECSAEMELLHEGTRYILPAGRSYDYDLVFGKLEETMIFYGTGTVSIIFRGGVL